MKSKLIKWLVGLVSVMISAGAGGVAVVIVDPAAFNLQAGIGKLLTVCCIFAITHGAVYLQQSPLDKVLTVDPTQPMGSANQKN